MGVHVIIRIWIGGIRDTAESRRVANLAFVELPPTCRPHEGLVVEPGWHKASEPAMDRTPVEFDAGRHIHTVRC